MLKIRLLNASFLAGFYLLIGLLVVPMGYIEVWFYDVFTDNVGPLILSPAQIILILWSLPWNFIMPELFDGEINSMVDIYQALAVPAGINGLLIFLIAFIFAKNKEFFHW